VTTDTMQWIAILAIAVLFTVKVIDEWMNQ